MTQTPAPQNSAQPAAPKATIGGDKLTQEAPAANEAEKATPSA